MDQIMPDVFIVEYPLNLFRCPNCRVWLTAFQKWENGEWRLLHPVTDQGCERSGKVYVPPKLEWVLEEAAE